MNPRLDRVVVKQREIEEVQEQNEDIKNNVLIVYIIFNIITRFIINNF